MPSTNPAGALPTLSRMPWSVWPPKRLIRSTSTLQPKPVPVSERAPRRVAGGGAAAEDAEHSNRAGALRCEAVADFHVQALRQLAAEVAVALRVLGDHAVGAPEVGDAAVRGAPGGCQAQRRALALGSRVEFQGGAQAPFVELAFRVAEQVASARFEAEAEREVPVVQGAADFSAEAVVHVAAVVAGAELEAGAEARLLVAAGRPLATAFDQQPEALHVRVRGGERAEHFVRPQAGDHGVRLQRPVQSLGLGEFPAQARGGQAQRGVRARFAEVVHEHRVAVAESGHGPQVDAVAERPMDVGQQRGHVQIQFALRDARLQIVELGAAARQRHADQRVARHAGIDAQEGRIDAAIDGEARVRGDAAGGGLAPQRPLAAVGTGCGAAERHQERSAAQQVGSRDARRIAQPGAMSAEREGVD